MPGAVRGGGPGRPRLAFLGARGGTRGWSGTPATEILGCPGQSARVVQNARGQRPSLVWQPRRFRPGLHAACCGRTRRRLVLATPTVPLVYTERRPPDPRLCARGEVRVPQPVQVFPMDGLSSDDGSAGDAIMVLAEKVADVEGNLVIVGAQWTRRHGSSYSCSVWIIMMCCWCSSPSS